MPITVLLIDDNPDQLTITKKALAKGAHDYLLDLARSGKEGFEKLATGRYDLVLCDYRLPDMDGIEVLKKFQEQQADKPFLLMTSVGNERLAAEAIKQGAYDYVVKDASYDELLPEILQQSMDRYQERKLSARFESERNEALDALKKEKAHLETMNAIMMEREGRILELKREVNTLLEALGRQKKYGI